MCKESLIWVLEELLSSVTPGPATSASLGNLLKMQIITASPSSNQTLQVGVQQVVV